MLTRRAFLGLLSALPCLGWVKPAPLAFHPEAFAMVWSATVQSVDVDR